MSIPVYILRRILISIPTILVVSMLGFLMMRYNFVVGPVDLGPVHVMDAVHIKNPIDPLAHLRNNPAITRAALQQEEARLGLDKPMTTQYWLWLTHLLHFEPDALMQGNVSGFFRPDLGRTFNGDDVAALIGRRAGNTLILNLAVLILSWVIAVPLGIYAALHWRTVADRLMTAMTALGMSFPSFVLALLLAVFVVKTNLLPLGGVQSENYAALDPLAQFVDRLRHLILPVFVLTVGSLSGIQRQMRANLLDVLQAEYVRTARAKGLPEHVVIWRHAVRTAINPLVTMMGYEFAGMMSGALLVETVLGYPGLGQLMYKAVLETDTNLVMATLVMGAVMLVLGNLMADILLKLVDPRISLEG
ncbi:MAG: ABC transporter permease [Candidatus Melainabacteria bacterium]